MNLYAWSPERRASRECIAHFVVEAVTRKQWAQSVSDEWWSLAGDMSRQWVTELRNSSIHAIARKSLEYCRMRSRMTVYGSYPSDRPAFELWQKLNQESRA